MGAILKSTITTRRRHCLRVAGVLTDDMQQSPNPFAAKIPEPGSRLPAPMPRCMTPSPRQSAFLSGGLAVAAGAAYALTEQPVWVLLAALALLPLTLPELGSLGAAGMCKCVLYFLVACFHFFWYVLGCCVNSLCRRRCVTGRSMRLSMMSEALAYLVIQGRRFFLK